VNLLVDVRRFDLELRGNNPAALFGKHHFTNFQFWSLKDCQPALLPAISAAVKSAKFI
jgi:hypothetical protein